MSTQGFNITQHPFFVYGTLRKGQNAHRNKFYGPNGENFIDVIHHGAYTKGAALTYSATQHSTFPQVVLTDDYNHITRGDLIFVNSSDYDEVKSRLDKYEGYPTLFDRVLSKVIYTDNGKSWEIFAWMYVRPPKKGQELTGLNVIVNGDWVEMQRMTGSAYQQDKIHQQLFGDE